MRRFRLRYQATDFELQVGDFVVGRSSECSLSLDDPLVSRKHATLHVTAEGVIAEDLASRNGITVNGERVKGTRPMVHGDKLMVGSQEMILVEVGQRERDKRATGIMIRCPSCQLPVAPDLVNCSHCGAAIAEPSLARMTMEMPVSAMPTSDAPDPITHAVSAFKLLAGIADKALALGRPEEAERILANLLNDLLTKAEAGRPVGDDSLQDATKYALRLADLTAKPRWVDWVFAIHLQTGKLMTADTIDALYGLVRKVKHPGSRVLTDYVTAMRGREEGFGAADRFLLKRLEGLARVVQA